MFILRVDVIILPMVDVSERSVLTVSGFWFIACSVFIMLLIGLNLFLYCLVPSRDSWNLLCANSFCFSVLPRVLVVVVNMIALCSVSGRNFDIHFLANFMRGVVGPLAWVMIVMLAVVLECFVRFDHLVICFGDHFWVLLRDTVLLVNVIVYLIVCLILLMVLVIFSFILLSGQRINMWLVLLIICLMVACILATLVHRSIASVVMVAIMLWKSCLVRFMSLFVFSCFDVACLLYF